MAKKATSTKTTKKRAARTPPPDTTPMPDYSFRVGPDARGGFEFALVKADGTMLFHSGPTSYKSRAAAMKELDAAVEAIVSGNCPVLDSVKG